MVLYFWRYIIPDTYNYTENPPYYQCERVIDDAESVIWCERYQEPGEISLLLRATPELLEFFWELGMIVTRSDSDRAMRVESIDMTTSSDGGDHIRIAGRSAESFTRDRVIMQRGRMYRTAVDSINYLIRENLGAYWYYHTDANHQHGANNLDCRRYFNLFAEGVSEIGGTQEVADDAFGKNLGIVITEYCKAHGFGFKVVFDGEKLVHSCYRGEDRTLNQSDRNAVIFADDFRNIGDSEYTRTRSEYYSHVIAGGSGAGLERAWSDAYTNYRDYKGIGGNMREKFIDASGVANDTLRGVASNAALASRETYSMTAEAVSGGQYKYREHYFLGDRVSVVNRYGLDGTATVSEVVETEDENGYYCIPRLTAFDTDGYISPERPEKPDPPPEPSPYDRFPDDCITAVKLDADGNETDEIYHFYRTSQSMSEFQHLYNDLLSELGSTEKVNVYCGNDISHLTRYDSITIADSIQRKVAMFKYPANWTSLVTNTDRANLETMSRNGSFLGVETVVLPTQLISIPENMFYGLSLFSSVVFRQDEDGTYKTERLEKYAFRNCPKLTTINLPGSITYINSYYGAFRDMNNLRTITIDKTEGSISGAPWGATNAMVIWTG